MKHKYGLNFFIILLSFSVLPSILSWHNYWLISGQVGFMDLDILKSIKNNNDKIAAELNCYNAVIIDKVTNPPNNLTTYNLIDEIQDAFFSPGKGVVFIIRSPGGVVDNIPQTVLELKKITKKPVIAVIDYMACSAAYELAVTADKIIATPKSMIGNIGTMTLLSNVSREEDNTGRKTILITSNDHKWIYNPYIAPDDPKNIKNLVDVEAGIKKTAEDFIQFVKNNREGKLNLEEADKLDLFTKSAVLNEIDALRIGLIDAIAPLHMIGDTYLDGSLVYHLASGQFCLSLCSQRYEAKQKLVSKHYHDLSVYSSLAKYCVDLELNALQRTQ